MAIADTARLIASLELQDKFSRPAGNLERSLGSLERKSDSLGKKLRTNIGQGFSSAGQNLSRLGLIAGGAVVAGLTLSIKAASDLNESLNKVDVVFGKFSGTVHAFGQTASTAWGQSRQQAEEAAATFGNLFTTVGLGPKINAQMSISLVKLAADLASFNNIDPAEALLKLKSGLVGEAEPLRAVGILLTEASVKTEAYRLHLAKNGAALTEAQKVQARYSLILRQSTKAQGDFARTAGGLANQQRILKARLTDTAAVIGTALLPTINKLVLQFTTFLGAHQADIQSFAAGLPAIAERLEGFVTGLPWDSIGGAFKLMGAGAKAAMDAFLLAPPWLQTAIITGWGLDKLTGGAVHKIVFSLVGEIAGGAAKGIAKLLTGTLFNRAVPQLVTLTPGAPIPVFVTNPGFGAGGGVPGAAGKVGGGAGGLLLNTAKWVLGPIAAAAIGVEIAKAINPDLFGGIQTAKAGEQKAIQEVVISQDRTKIAKALDAVNAQIHTSNLAAGMAQLISFVPIAGDALGNVGPELFKQRELLQKQLAAIDQAARDDVDVQRQGQAEIRSENQRRASRDAAAAARTVALQAAVRTGFLQGAGVTRQTGAETRAAVDRLNARQAGIQASIDRGREVTGAGLQRLAAKDFSPTVSVRVNTVANISISKVVTATTAFHIATGGMGGLTVGASVL